MLEQLLQNESFVNLVITVLSIIITAVVAPAVRTWLLAQVGDKNFELLNSFITRLVESAQQQWGDEDNKTKKQYVLHQAAAFAETLGLKVSETTLHALIEAAVFNLKQWQPMKWVTVEPAAPADSGEATKSLSDFTGVQE